MPDSINWLNSDYKVTPEELAIMMGEISANSQNLESVAAGALNWIKGDLNIANIQFLKNNWELLWKVKWAVKWRGAEELSQKIAEAKYDWQPNYMVLQAWLKALWYKWKWWKDLIINWVFGEDLFLALLQFQWNSPYYKNKSKRVGLIDWETLNSMNLALWELPSQVNQATPKSEIPPVVTPVPTAKNQTETPPVSREVALLESLKARLWGRYYVIDKWWKITNKPWYEVAHFWKKLENGKYDSCRYLINLQEDSAKIDRLFAQIERNWEGPDRYSLVINSDWQISVDRDVMVVESQETKIQKFPVLQWVADKEKFAKILAEEAAHQNYDKNLDREWILRLMKAKVEELVRWKNTPEERISAIYTWITQNIKYVAKIDHQNFRQSSWLTTFWWEWICSGFSRLFVYMLLFAGVENVEYQTGDVINVREDAFNRDENWKVYAGHAWVKIWDKYYDPTFDSRSHDEINYRQITYYGLTKDIFFTRRYADWDIPSELLDSIGKGTYDARNRIVLANLLRVYRSYKANGNKEILWLPIFDKVRVLDALWVDENAVIDEKFLRSKFQTLSFSKEGVSADGKLLFRRWKNGYKITANWDDNLSALSQLYSKSWNINDVKIIECFIDESQQVQLILSRDVEIETIVDRNWFIDIMRQRGRYLEVGDKGVFEVWWKKYWINEYPNWWKLNPKDSRINGLIRERWDNLGNSYLYHQWSDYRFVDTLGIEPLQTLDWLKTQMWNRYYEVTVDGNKVWTVKNKQPNMRISKVGANWSYYAIKADGDINYALHALKKKWENLQNYSLLYIDWEYGLFSNVETSIN